jgi:hypothetical protein
MPLSINRGHCYGEVPWLKFRKLSNMDAEALQSRIQQTLII